MVVTVVDRARRGEAMMTIVANRDMVRVVGERWMEGER